jgi:hypothetical protein
MGVGKDILAMAAFFAPIALGLYVLYHESMERLMMAIPITAILIAWAVFEIAVMKDIETRRSLFKPT